MRCVTMAVAHMVRRNVANPLLLYKHRTYCLRRMLWPLAIRTRHRAGRRICGGLNEGCLTIPYPPGSQVLISIKFFGAQTLDIHLPFSMQSHETMLEEHIRERGIDETDIKVFPRLDLPPAYAEIQIKSAPSYTSLRRESVGVFWSLWRCWVVSDSKMVGVLCSLFLCHRCRCFIQTSTMIIRKFTPRH